jgi:hypothetical protein
MSRSFIKKIAELPESIKQAIINIKKTTAVSNVIEAFAKQQEPLEKIVGVLGKVILYTLTPLYLAFIFVFILIFTVCRFIFKGLFYGMRGLGKVIVIIGKGILAICVKIKYLSIHIGRSVSAYTANAIKLIPRLTKIFKKIIAVLQKALLFVLVPPLFVFLLIIILFSKIFPFLYKWIAYGITALKIILTFAGQRRGIDENELDEAIEYAGFTYDSEQDIFYSNMNPWQRKFGYCRLYDEAAALWGMIVDCEPIYFEYDGKKWLIEIWKGQYDLTTGCEIGVYTTEGPTLDIPGVFNGTFYNSGSNSDLLHMSCCLQKNNKTLFIREDEHWWLTGFKLGEFSNPSELTMKVTISLKDETMCNLVVKGLKKAGYSDNEIVKAGKQVSFSFTKPKTSQPFTRMKVTDWIIQKKNKHLCKKYQEITGTYNNMQDKLMAIQQKAPKMYSKIINIGKSKKLYDKVRTVNNYLK